MARLYRPRIPDSVKVQVGQRQLHEKGTAALWKNYCAVSIGETLATKVALLKAYLAEAFGCDVSDLRLDHDPPLGARAKVPAKRSTKGCWFNSFGVAMRYEPDANDPEHLFYRPHGTQFDGSHLIKTNVRGDHGQHPDRVLIKKQRRLERGPKPKRGPKIRSRGFSSAKQKLPSRPFPKREK